MVCRRLSAWSSSIRHVARQLYVCLNSHRCMLVIVLAVLTALHYLIANTFEVRQFEPLGTLNSKNSSVLSQRSWINNLHDVLTTHNSSFNGSMHQSMERNLSPIKKINVEPWHNCVILTLNVLGSASSFVSNISVSSVNPTTTPSFTVPLTGKFPCAPIPSNLSKYYETLHFTFLFCCLLVHTEACNETF